MISTEDIQFIMTAGGFTQATLAAEIGVSQSAVSRWLAKKAVPDPAQQQALQDLHAKFATRPAPAPPDSFLPEILKRDDLMTTNGNFPVYAAAEGGDGHIILTTDVIEYQKRPAMLEGVKSAYGILVVGESMSPAYRPGDIALVDPRLGHIRDTEVVLYEWDEANGNARASIKTLVNYTDQEWTVSQLNPPKTFTLSRRQWTRCHRVVGKFSRR